MGSVSGGAGKGDGNLISSEENTNPFMLKGNESLLVYSRETIQPCPPDPCFVIKALGQLWSGEFQGCGHSLLLLAAPSARGWRIPGMSSAVPASPGMTQHFPASLGISWHIPVSLWGISCPSMSQILPAGPPNLPFQWFNLGSTGNVSPFGMALAALSAILSPLWPRLLLPTSSSGKISRNCPQSWVIFLLVWSRATSLGWEVLEGVIFAMQIIP